MNIDEEIQKAVSKAKERYGLTNLNIEVVEGTEASIGKGKINIGRDNPLELIECITLHEIYHIIMRINQTKDFEELDKGNRTPYIQTKIRIWDKIKDDFPELSENVEKCREFFNNKIA